MDDAAAAAETVCGAAGGRAHDHAVGDGFGEEAPADEDGDDGEVRVGAAVDDHFVEGVDVAGGGGVGGVVGDADAGAGEDADFEPVAEEDPRAAGGAEGFAADG